MININDVAVIKITGEEVWVLGPLDNGELEVRRPTQSNEGVRWLVESFRPEELESVDDNSIRRRNRQAKERNEQLADQAELQQKILQLKPKVRFPDEEAYGQMQ